MTNLEIILMMGGDKSGGNPYAPMLTLVLIIAVFYFFMIRPQMKRTKEQKKFREALKRGDKIITIGGIHGRIVEVQETTFTIEVEGGNKLRIEKTAVASSTSDQLGENK
ncbi:MAG: preprotein translocase subunit YajC [Bacteroidales bacterium]|nr:preprotein translocase subunit YajC [Bacteroidales bacterium]